MRLREIAISSYKSIKSRKAILLDERVTVLIGANDHGKSNILYAIRCLNDEDTLLETDVNWDAESDTIAEIQWNFTPSAEDMRKLETLVPAGDPIADAVSELVSEMPESTTGELTNEVPVEPAPSPEVDTSVTTFPKNESGDLVFMRNSSTNQVEIKELPLEGVPTTATEIILAMRPRVELFGAPTDNLIDEINKGTLDAPENEFMQGIFRLAGLWEHRDTIFALTDTNSKILVQASRQLTTALSDRWNQGKDLEWMFIHSGNNGDHISIKINDPAIDRQHTRASLRSSGFRTYFLLTMMTYARNANKESDSYIYLFDEPGIYLHPRAQLDLQRSLEILSDNAQIIYTTHSLFLVNKNYPRRNRVISKTAEGTQVDLKPFTKNWKSVRESLGILMSNNFLIADKTLLVEGPSDVVYILDAIKKKKASNELDVDLNDLSIVDAGNSQNYVAIAKLMLLEGRDVVALFDGDTAGTTIKSQLNKVCQQDIQKGKLQLHQLPENKSTEDIFTNLSTLKIAIKQAYDYLITSGVREAKPGIDAGDIINGLSLVTGENLGRTTDKLTKTLFSDSADSISKLSIALKYEDLRVADEEPLPSDALDTLKMIRGELQLKGEKSPEVGVFEEAA